MKPYTGGGDKGDTSLFDGTRVAKSVPRVEAYGTVDELAAFVALARMATRSDRVRPVLERVENELFTLGADLATPSGSKRSIPRVEARHTDALARDAEAFFAEVGNPGGFVLAGETEPGARLHVCRTVARRAERLVVAAAADDGVNPEVVRYLNRLSSLFYALAVWADKVEGGRTLRNPVYE